MTQFSFVLRIHFYTHQQYLGSQITVPGVIPAGDFCCLSMVQYLEAHGGHIRAEFDSCVAIMRIEFANNEGFVTAQMPSR